MLILMLLCGGCVYQQNRSLGWYADEVDLAHQGEVGQPATVTGQAGSILLWSWDCWFDYPARAKRLVLNPGLVSIRVSCEVDGVTDSLFSASLSFEAEPGGVYTAGSALSSCLSVRDVARDRLVVRAAACDQ